MVLLLATLVILISLLIVGSLFAHRITTFAQQYLPNHGDEGEQLVLWSGLLLAAFVTGLLVMYLLLYL
jgi:hypothetical protein